jgi:hypothetical protein
MSEFFKSLLGTKPAQPPPPPSMGTAVSEFLTNKKMREQQEAEIAAKIEAQKPKGWFGTGGKVPYNGGSYVVRTGPKGGKYILAKGKKVYLKK